MSLDYSETLGIYKVLMKTPDDGGNKKIIIENFLSKLSPETVKKLKKEKF
jgi:hypothetical protein